MFYPTIKRVFDITLSASLLVMTLPLNTAIFVAIKKESPGPIIYKQERLAKNGKKFICYKYRTMVDNAEKNTGPVVWTASDSRVTKFGKFLRKYYFDEIPQLWNILKGDMSFVGPRPERMFFHKKFSKHPGWTERLKVPQGLTGWAQVHYHTRNDAKNKAILDKYYVNNCGVHLDTHIILRTISMCIREFRKGIIGRSKRD